MIETICGIDHKIVMSIAAMIGAILYSLYTIYEAKSKLGNKFKFELSKILDTVWQSAAIGSVAGMAVGCGWEGIVIAILSGVGIDKICSKLRIKESQFLNVIYTLVGLISKINRRK